MGWEGRGKVKREEWRGEGGEGQGGRGRGGEGFIIFHLIFQKTWAEPGNPS